MAGSVDIGRGGIGTRAEYPGGRPRQGRQPIGGLLFDKDGTIFDFHLTWSGWTRALIEDLAGGDPARRRELAAALQFDLDRGRFAKTSPAVAGTLDVIVDAILRVMPEMQRDRLHDALVRRAAEVRPVEAAPLAPLLDGLRAAGYALGVATNDAAAAAEAQLAGAGVLARFDFVAGYDSGFGAKPGTGMHRAFCRASALAPGEVAMIGDSSHDLRSAREAGMIAVAVLTGPAEAEDLAGEADALLPDIGALPGWLGLGGG